VRSPSVAGENFETVVDFFEEFFVTSFLAGQPEKTESLMALKSISETA
jgi:hypothetical protein